MSDAAIQSVTLEYLQGETVASKTLTGVKVGYRIKPDDRDTPHVVIYSSGGANDKREKTFIVPSSNFISIEVDA